MATLEATVEFLNQRVRSKNMVLHGVPDTAAISRPADLERFVKCRLDDAAPGRGPSGVSQSITAVTHIGKPGGGNRAVLVEYASSQAKHKAYALSRELRRQGFHLADELTPKQLQAQQAMDLPLRQQYATLFSSETDTMRSFFAQKDHMQVFNFILDCLDVLKI
ncbi:hypothetical protein ABBQ32_007575 [Trebouxia sp. C0010 RCD-2024]